MENPLVKTPSEQPVNISSTRQTFWQSVLFNWHVALFGLAYMSVRQRLQVGVVVFGVLLFAYSGIQTQLTVHPQVARAYQHKVTEPITVQLGQLVKVPQNITITPAVKGRWGAQQSVVSGTTMIFTPESGQLSASTTYTITFSGLERLTGQSVGDKTVIVESEPAAGIVGITPKSGTTVSRNTVISLQLNRNNNNIRKLRAVFKPAIDVEVISTDDKLFTWKPKQPLNQGVSYVAEIFDDNALDQKTIATSEFTVTVAPTVANMTSRTYYYPGDTLDITFSKPMNAAQKVVEGIEGSGTWKSPTNYVFTPQNLVVNKGYDFVIIAGLAATDESVLESAYAGHFSTPGVVRANFSGVGNSTDLKQAVTVTFDQPVNRKAAEERFNISPVVAGSLSWKSDAQMIFTPSGSYDQQSTYIVSIAAGVTPVRFGLTGLMSSSRFTTKAIEFRLNVPLYRQQFALSCESAALRMALAYRGIAKSDLEIVREIGYSPRAIDKATNSWDDPNQMFVGDLSGRQDNLTGYGVYVGPIARAARAFGRVDSTAEWGVSTDFIARQIYAGNPVVIIGSAGGARRVTWNGPNGLVEAWYGEHARTVIGVVGRVSSPVGFIVNDPLVSKPLYWTPAQLQRDIDTTPQMPSQVVVVR